MVENGNGDKGWLEKAPLSSKKFLAYLLAEMTWKVILFAMVMKWADGVEMALMLAVVLVAGFVEVCMIGGQAALDKYVRVAQIAAGKAPEADTPVPPPPEEG